MKVWRICRQRYAATAFSGEGAKLSSGRWNPHGVPMVYTSLSLSLAVLEVLVHLDPDLEPDDLVAIAAEIPGVEGDMERIEESQLPSGWQISESLVLKNIGEDWVRSQRGLVLLVPSIVVEEEWNALINPSHGDASTIKVLTPKPFRFDERILQRSRPAPAP